MTGQIQSHPAWSFGTTARNGQLIVKNRAFIWFVFAREGGSMTTSLKAWRVTVLLELNRGMGADEFGVLTAHSHGRALLQRGSPKSGVAPELSATAIIRATQPGEAVAGLTRAVELRLASIPTDNKVVRVRNYLVAA